MMQINKSVAIILIFTIIIIGFIGFFAYTKIKDKFPGKYDSFAMCLRDEGVKFYSVYWLDYTQEQKKMFGKSFQYINYVECSLPEKAGITDECRQQKIKIYPTWEFKNGEKAEKKMSLEELSGLTGCSLKS